MDSDVHLGVNIDHVATLRQARQTHEPDPVWGAVAAELGGADSITIHVREDRRHIQDRDLRLLRQTVQVPLNLELACADEIVELALAVVPDQATLVPEKRQEVTTEGGLDLVAGLERVRPVVDQLVNANIRVSLFLDPVVDQIEAAAALGAYAVELHTGQYALAQGSTRELELARLVAAAARVRSLGMQLHAGHGLNYRNVGPIARLAGMRELHIGHSIVSRAIFVGLQEAVREMKRVIRGERGDCAATPCPAPTQS